MAEEDLSFIVFVLVLLFIALTIAIVFNSVDENIRKKRRETSATTNNNNDGKPHIALCQDEECGICLDPLWERIKENKLQPVSLRTLKLFAIQENCCHVFCWNCLERWKTQIGYNGHLCPICLQHSSRTVWHSQFVIKSMQVKRSLFRQSVW